MLHIDTKFLLPVTLACLCTAPLTARAESPKAPHTHTGLFVRLTSGFGGAITGTELPGGEDVSLSGAAGTFGLSIGAAVMPSWLVGLEAYASAVVNPTLEIDKMEATVKDVSWTTAYLGASTSYYVSPLNLYVGGGLGVVRMGLKTTKETTESEVGFAAKLTVGKEWWVSDRWGVGVALDSMLGAVPEEKDSDKGWGVFALGLALSATYN